MFECYEMWNVEYGSNVDIEYVFCLSETVPIYMKEEVLYIFLLALILSILVSNSNPWSILVIYS